MRTEIRSLGNAFTASRGQGATVGTAGSLRRGAVHLELLHRLSRLLLVPAKLFHSLSFLDSKGADTTLISLDIMDMQVDLLLQDNQLFLHLDFQVVSRGLNLCLHLDHFFKLLAHLFENFGPRPPLTPGLCISLKNWFPVGPFL